MNRSGIFFRLLTVFGFLVSTGLILYERFTPIYINCNYVRLILYTFSGSVIVIAAARYIFGLKSLRTYLLFSVLTFAICLAKAYFTWGGDWKSQTILYAKVNNPLETVEYQMRADRFAFGYKRRIVKREKIVLFVDYVTDVDTNQLDPAQWKRIDRRVNRMKLRHYNDAPRN